MAICNRSLVTLSQRSKFLFGIILLLIVDLIWVLSAEISVYLFQDADFNKPFFITYFNTAMFTIYLMGFLFIRRWQYQVLTGFSNTKSVAKIFKEVERFAQADPHVRSLMASENASRCSTPVTEADITPPTYENMTDGDSSTNSNAGSVDARLLQETNRKVSFNNVKEVRSLGRKHGDAQVLARMSQRSINELRDVLLEINKKFSLTETMKFSLTFVVLWFIANLMYQEALAIETAALTNILSSTSGLFTLILAGFFPSSIADKFSISKLIAVVVSFVGIFITCWFDPNRQPSQINFGELYALVGAVCYALYLVIIKKKVGDDHKLDIPLFFGFVGLFGAFIFLPGFFILHYGNIEHFEFPSDKKTWGYLLMNALVGTVLSELLWLWGCFLTSSLMATLSLGLVIPLTVLWDFLINKVKFSWFFVAGTIPIVLSFIAVSILTHYGDYDPVKNCLWLMCCPVSQTDEDENLLSQDQNTKE